MTYNLMHEPWIPVRYLDGKCCKIGIQQCFQDAAYIKCLRDPIYYGQIVPIYTYAVLHLLTHIVESAYFKEETEYAAADTEYLTQLAKTGLNNPIIANYVQKWGHRFDLFGEKLPLMQDAALRNKNKASDNVKDKTSSIANQYSFVPLINMLAPSANQLCSGFMYECLHTFEDGSQTVLQNYIPDIEMAAYCVLMLASITPQSAHYFASMGGNACEWIVRTGANLEETIILNCVPLTHSSMPTPTNPDIKPDAPVWEWDSPTEYREYIQQGTFGDNLLAATYAPILRVCLIPGDNNQIVAAYLYQKSEIIANEAKEEDLLKEIKKSFIALHPNAIKRFDNPKNAPEELEARFATYYAEHDAWLHAVVATASTGKSHQHCNILNQPALFPYDITLYYRNMNKEKTTLLGCGSITLPAGTQRLLDIQCSDAAKKVQNAMENAVYDMEIAVRAMRAQAMPEMWKKPTACKTARESEHYVNLSRAFNDYFCNVFCENVGVNASEATKSAILYLREICLQQFDQKYQNARNVSLYTRVRDKIQYRFNFYLQEESV